MEDALPQDYVLRRQGRVSPPGKFSRLYFDAETSPNVALTWRIGQKISLSFENIVTERAIICIAWKWEGKSKVECLTWNKNQCDKQLLKRFVPEMHKADEVVTHNGDRFDIKWIRTRCLKHGIPMAPDFVSIDTLKAARSKFYFNSNRLDYIAQFLDLGKKRPTGFDLWKRVLLEKDPRALSRMVSYCKHDVKLLEQIWTRLDPYVPAKSHRGQYVSDCPECGSPHMVVNGYITTAQGYKKVKLRCVDCGKYHTIADSRQGVRI